MTSLEKFGLGSKEEGKLKQLGDEDSRWRVLLAKPVDMKTIRDPVHKDIRLTPLEVEVVDTKEFQRLRHHRQLGPCYLVYPGAEHTRFQHALGTLYVAQRIISAINNPIVASSGSEKVIKPREIVLTRLCALLHDIVNIPFGHTLEDEGNLVERDWKDSRRIEKLLSEPSTIGNIIVSRVEGEVGRGEGTKFLDELKQILTSNDESDIERLPHPFVSDIVSNTICADLLDYLRRDTYFTGIQKSYDWRIVRYFVLASYRDHDRLAIRLWTGKQRMKRDILSELISLLQMRYSLAEMVYYHHAKMAASAMLVRAVDDSGILRKSFTYLLESGDDQLLSSLTSGTSDSTKEILRCYSRRHLYKPVYQISYAKRTAGSIIPEQISKVAKTLHEPGNSRELEAKLESVKGLESIGLSKGHVIVFCPNPNMSMKVATTKVVWQDDEVYNLIDVPDEDLRDEVKSIEEKHRKLWKMVVFLHPSSYKSADSRGVLHFISQKCQELIGVINELPLHMSELETRVIQGEDVLPRLEALKQIHDYSISNPSGQITQDEIVELSHMAAARGERDGKYVRLTDQQIGELLRAYRESKHPRC